jgi:hypothetical protein
MKLDYNVLNAPIIDLGHIVKGVRITVELLSHFEPIGVQLRLINGAISSITL